jgi:uncharacterized protein (TIRG00374 family)
MKRLIGAACSVAILALLFWKVDRTALIGNLRATRIGLFSTAIALFIPQIAAMSWRWKVMVSVFVPISGRESASVVLASQTMNLVLPSKAGDLMKAVFLKRTGILDLKRATNLVVFEKLLDLAALALIMLLGVALLLARGSGDSVQRHAALLAALFGLFAVGIVALLYFIPINFIPGYRALLRYLDTKPRLAKVKSLLLASHEVISLLQSRGGNRGFICTITIGIWLLHLAQIYLFFLSLKIDAPVAQFASMVPLAIFIGLLPISIAGFGTRDSAIIAFFPMFPSALMLSVALYINLRYIVPAIAGLPFLNRYITYARELNAGA